MKNNKIILLLCLVVVSIFSLSLVSANDNVTNHPNEVVNAVDDTIISDEAVNDNIIKENSIKNSKINKNIIENTKEKYYSYDEDEEYGLNDGSYVNLSYEKIKTNQYNISAKVYNSYNNPVKEGEITVYVKMGNKNYPYKTLTFNNGTASYIQKFHTRGTVKIYSNEWHTVSYAPLSEDGQVQTNKSFRSSVHLASNTLQFKVDTAYITAKVPKKCDIDDKVSVTTYTYDDGISSDRGQVSIYVDDKLVKSKKVYDGGANFSLSIKNVGKHIIETDYTINYGETYYDTNVVEITRKKENITITLPKKGATGEEIVITTKVVNGTDKINKGNVILKNNGKQFANVKVKNGETTSIYRLPYYSGTYTITANYVNNNKTITSVSKEFNVSDDEKLTYTPIKTATTQKKVVFKATVTNPHVTVNYGSIKVNLGDKLLLNKAVKNGKVTANITIPNKSGTFALKVQYIKQKNVITQQKNTIKVTDSEKISYTFPKQLLPDSKYTFKVRVTSPNAIVNTGQIKYKIGSKAVTAKVNKGMATITLKTSKYEQNLTATVSYIKNNKTVTKKTSKINVYYTYKTYVYPPWDTIKGNKIKITSKVENINGIHANSGKVIFYLNNKKIGTAKVKNGEASISYKANLNPGIYKITAVYYDKNNKKVAKEDNDYITVVNKLTTAKNVKVKTLTPSSEFEENSRTSIGSSEYVNCITSWQDSRYDIFVSLTNSYWYYPKYNRLVKARIYYLVNGKTYTKVYGESDIFALYRITVENKYEPYKVEIAYRSMNAKEKRFMKECFGIKY